MSDLPLVLSPDDEVALRSLLDASKRDRWAGLVLTRGMLPVVPNFESLPTASALYRFALMGVRGDGATTPDIVYTCLRDAAGSYAWEIAATG